MPRITFGKSASHHILHAFDLYYDTDDEIAHNNEKVVDCNGNTVLKNDFGGVVDTDTFGLQIQNNTVVDSEGKDISPKRNEKVLIPHPTDNTTLILRAKYDEEFKNYKKYTEICADSGFYIDEYNDYLNKLNE